MRPIWLRLSSPVVGLVVVLVVAAPSLAQPSPPPGPLRLTLFGSVSGFGYSSRDGVFADGGFGLALEYRWRPRLGLELSLAGWRHELLVSHGGELVTDEVRTYPVNLVGQYHFTTDGPWKPYLGVGARYVRGPRSVIGELEDHLSPQIAAGVEYQTRDHMSLTFDARRLLRDDDVRYDPYFQASLGLGWRF
jgi:outer membrane protein W